MLKIGWKAGPEQYPPKELLDYAIAASRRCSYRQIRRSMLNSPDGMRIWDSHILSFTMQALTNCSS